VPQKRNQHVLYADDRFINMERFSYSQKLPQTSMMFVRITKEKPDNQKNSHLCGD